ncbi:sugar ABC transporter permease [Sorangium cellulosum]|uniref:Sugar ABC transporter permease n=1 Tax=Sorangium cellulosum TaxID=56 RepID=A0A2L0EW23_SORCE|nr:ABC transporter permease [Sorangium cellulosum]AUX43510.1 sugar ABC transporter permease [Sorangium cellulosum]
MITRSEPRARGAAPLLPDARRKVFGVLWLLVVVSLATALMNNRFLLADNLENLIRRTALFGILSVGAGLVIMTGGIDLSIGSVVALAGSLLPWLLAVHKWPAALAVPLLLVIALCIGLAHGLLITKLRLQPFVVTLCGLLLYRGTARGITGDLTQGFGVGHESLRYLSVGTPFSVPVPFLSWIAEGGLSPYAVNPFTGARTRLDVITWIDVPMPFLLFLAIVLATSVFLRRTIYGRYLMALGRNEQAARYSGVNTDAMTILAYVLCALLSCVGGMLFALEVNSAQPVDFGNFYELYAIAAAVLGGFSLRGGEGSVLGVILGTALMQVLRNAINMLGVPTQIEYAVIGAVILSGVVADELVRRYAGARRKMVGA